MLSVLPAFLRSLHMACVHCACKLSHCMINSTCLANVAALQPLSPLHCFLLPTGRVYSHSDASLGVVVVFRPGSDGDLRLPPMTFEPVLLPTGRKDIESTVFFLVPTFLLRALLASSLSLSLSLSLSGIFARHRRLTLLPPCPDCGMWALGVETPLNFLEGIQRAAG